MFWGLMPLRGSWSSAPQSLKASSTCRPHPTGHLPFLCPPGAPHFLQTLQLSCPQEPSSGGVSCQPAAPGWPCHCGWVVGMPLALCASSLERSRADHNARPLHPECVTPPGFSPETIPTLCPGARRHGRPAPARSGASQDHYPELWPAACPSTGGTGWFVWSCQCWAAGRVPLCGVTPECWTCSTGRGSALMPSLICVGR